MMNYLWSGLIVLSFLFAIGGDANDIRVNRFRNGRPLTIELLDAGGRPSGSPDTLASVAITPAAWADFVGPGGQSLAHTLTVPATVSAEGGRLAVRLTGGTLPPPLDAVRKFHDPDDKVLLGTGFDVRQVSPPGTLPDRFSISFPTVRFARLRAINDAAVEFAGKAFTVVLSLVGGLALWMGLLKIAEDSGLVNVIVKVIRPLIGPLFPNVPRDSPALGLITLNVAANLLALGNAATPIGIKAMQELQKLNKRPDTATNAMCMLLAINTAGVTLLPSPTLVGIMGPRVGVIMGPILATTAVSLVIAIVACKLLERGSRDTADDLGGEAASG